MKTRFFSVAMAALLLLSGCYDDSAILDRLGKLEQQCTQQNADIQTLQGLVSALQNNDFVTGVTEVKDGDKVTGYRITFSKGEEVIINVSGAGASAVPQIGVIEEDGVYYWAIDGVALEDANGNKVKASATDGKDGNTPKLKIEDGFWYVSYDNGANWEKYSEATGAAGKDGVDGDSMFESVTSDELYVYITLKDGTKLTLPIVACVQTSFVKGEGSSYTLTVALSRENKSNNVAFDIDFGVATGTTAEACQYDNVYYPAKVRLANLPEGTTITNEEVRSMSPGTSEVSYTITLPEITAIGSLHLIEVKSATVDGSPVEIRGGQKFIISSNPVDVYAKADHANHAKSLEKYGLMVHDSLNTYIFHPEASMQYGGRDMTICLFDNNLDTDWAIRADSVFPDCPNMNEDGTWNGNHSAWGKQIDKEAIWALVDMNEVRDLSGMEWWRRNNNGSTPGVRTFEFYALDNCSYMRYNAVLDWKSQDAVYLGTGSYSSDVNEDLLSVAWENIQTRYLLIVFRNGEPTKNIHGLSMNIFGPKAN